MLVLQQSYSQPFAAGKSKFLGNVYSNSSPSADWITYWNQVTPENAGKWLYTEPSRNGYSWGGVDAAYNFAKQNGIPFRYHTLVWGQQYPTWIDALTPTEQANEVEEIIRLVGERYPDIDFVDVVNEPLVGHAPATYRNALGGSGTTGWDWIIWTFEKARKYIPKAKLFINEYNIVNSTGNTAAYLQIIRLLKERGLIDGIGIQGHRFEIESAPLATIKANLDSLGSTGLPIHITEFDLGNLNNTGTPNDSVQLALYKQRFPLFWEHPSVKGITLWGYLAGLTWQTTAYLRNGLGVERSALQWLRSYVTAPTIPIIISPGISTTNSPRNTKLIWSSAETATSYGIQIATDSLFSSITLELSVTDTFLTTFPLESFKKYFWRVNASNDRGASYYSVISSFTTGDQTVSVKEQAQTPKEFSLSQNYPNPFNPSTVISYQLPMSNHVTIRVYDVLGKEVATVVNEIKETGKYTVQLSMNNYQLTSGVYFYTMNAGNFVQTKKLILLK